MHSRFPTFDPSVTTPERPDSRHEDCGTATPDESEPSADSIVRLSPFLKERLSLPFSAASPCAHSDDKSDGSSQQRRSSTIGSSDDNRERARSDSQGTCPFSELKQQMSKLRNALLEDPNRRREFELLIMLLVGSVPDMEIHVRGGICMAAERWLDSASPLKQQWDEMPAQKNGRRRELVLSRNVSVLLERNSTRLRPWRTSAATEQLIDCSVWHESVAILCQPLEYPSQVPLRIMQSLFQIQAEAGRSGITISGADDLMAVFLIVVAKALAQSADALSFHALAFARSFCDFEALCEIDGYAETRLNNFEQILLYLEEQEQLEDEPDDDQCGGKGQAK
jgi:hypothetical protein